MEKCVRKRVQPNASLAGYMHSVRLKRCVLLCRSESHAYRCCACPVALWQRPAGAADEEALQPCHPECVFLSWSCPFGCLSFELHPDREGCARQVLRGGSVAAADAGALVPLIEEELDQLRHPLPRRSARQQSGLPPVSARAQARNVLMLFKCFTVLVGSCCPGI